MFRLIALGLLAALLFSVTFILNRAMSVEGGHWFWSACLRFGYSLAILSLGLLVLRGRDYMRQLLGEFFRNWLFWTFSGSFGFGAFYALVCYGAQFSAGWVVATTWQFTIIFSLVVLRIFGRRLSPTIWLLAFIVLVGVAMANMGHGGKEGWGSVFQAAWPVMLGAFAYPFGNQLVWEAMSGRRGFPQVNQELLDHAFAKVLLMTMGSVPFWIILYPLSGATTPLPSQLLNTAIVAICSGVAGTTLFLQARSLSRNGKELAAVDATQASEVPFTILGEVLFLGAAIPTLTSFLGIALAIAGLILIARQTENAQPVKSSPSTR